MLAGGAGTRLAPLTKVASKQLLPIYDKPLIFYPISTLMLAGIREILIIVAPEQLSSFRQLLGDGTQFGVSFMYKIQEHPAGIAQSLIIGSDFLSQSSCCLILGDNIFHGPGLGRSLAADTRVLGAKVFGYSVRNPEAYGIASIDDNGVVQKLVEKPERSISNIAIPGLYFLDERASDFALGLKPSERGELEILDLLECYRKNNELRLEKLPLGTAWFDSGTFSDMHDASSYVRLMQERTGMRVGDPTDVARVQGWI